MKVETIDINTIQVRPDRVRKDFKGITALAASIRTFGLLHPLVLDNENYLISGERRLRALRKLKRTEVPVVRYADLSDEKKLELELEENIQREDLSWQEQLLAKKRLFELRNKNLTDFSEELGESIGKLSEDLQLARELEAGNQVLWQEEKKTKAKAKLKMETQALQYKALAKVLAGPEGPEGPEDSTPKDSTAKPTLILGDSREVLKSLRGPFACMITDPPWGVGLDDATWDDRLKQSLALMHEVFTLAYERMMPDSHAYIRFGTLTYQPVLDLLRSIGWSVSPIPIIEVLPKNKSGMGRLVTWNSCYSTWFFCRKGNRILQPPVDNVLYSTNEGRVFWHPSPVSPGFFHSFIKASTYEGEEVLDPFAGSASVGVACKELKRKYLGIEIDKTYFSLASVRLLKGGE